MKIAYAHNMITKDAVSNVLKRNTDAKIKDNVDPSSIKYMCEVLTGVDPQSIEEALKEMRAYVPSPENDTDKVDGGLIDGSLLLQDNAPTATDVQDTLATTGDVIVSFSIIDHIVARLVTIEDKVHLQLLDSDRVVYDDSISKSCADIDLDNLGSGKADDGTYYISLAAYKDDDSHYDISIIYAGGTAKVYDITDWTKSESNLYFVYSSNKQDFVSWREADE